MTDPDRVIMRAISSIVNDENMEEVMEGLSERC